MHAKTQVTLWVAVVCVLGVFAQRLLADEPEAAAPAATQSASPQLTYQTGDIPLPNKIAKLLVAWGNLADMKDGTADEKDRKSVV